MDGSPSPYPPSFPSFEERQSRRLIFSGVQARDSSCSTKKMAVHRGLRFWCSLRRTARGRGGRAKVGNAERSSVFEVTRAIAHSHLGPSQLGRLRPRPRRRRDGVRAGPPPPPLPAGDVPQVLRPQGHLHPHVRRARRVWEVRHGPLEVGGRASIDCRACGSRVSLLVSYYLSRA